MEASCTFICGRGGYPFLCRRNLTFVRPSVILVYFLDFDESLSATGWLAVVIIITHMHASYKFVISKSIVFVNCSTPFENVVGFVDPLSLSLSV